MSGDTEPTPSDRGDGEAIPSGAEDEPSGPRETFEEQSLWDAYWERFRRQQVDDPVEERREGMWDRFKRQQVDDPVDQRRSRRSS